MIPEAFDLISTLLAASILPVATTERVRSVRSTLTSFSGSILVVPLLRALSEKNAAPLRTSRQTSTQGHFLDFLRLTIIITDEKPREFPSTNRAVGEPPLF